MDKPHYKPFDNVTNLDEWRSRPNHANKNEASQNAEANNNSTHNTDQANMSNTTITQDWAESKLSQLDSKISLNRKDWEAEVKDMNHKFDLLVAQSDARFEKLFAEMKSEAEKNELRISARFSQTDAIIARTETNLTRWLMGVIFAMLGLTFSFWKTTHDWQVTPMIPPPASVQSPAVTPQPAPPEAQPTKAPGK